MKVVLRHQDAWLLIRGTYVAKDITLGGRRRRKKNTRPSKALWAESIEKPPVNGMRYHGEVIVPATKIRRFILGLLEDSTNAVVVIEPHTIETYSAKIYAPDRSTLKRALEKAKQVLAKLVRSAEAESEEEEEAEEEEEEEE